MCGIILSKGLALESVESIAKRGPDHQEILKYGDVYMGFTRLAIRGLGGHANQPVQSLHSEFFLLFNGEIYNTDVLQKRLRQKLDQESLKSDTLVLKAFIEEYSLEDLIDCADGMYSIVVYYYKKNIIRFVRDGFGEKPLYYYNKNSKLVVGSTVDSVISVLKENGLPLVINSKSVVEFVAFGYGVNSETLLSGIYRVEKGRIYNVAADSVMRMGYILKKETPQYTSSNLKIKIHEGICSRFVSEVPIGVMLSGGKDSTLVAAILRKSGKLFSAITVATNNDDNDESKRASEFCTRLSIGQRIILPTDSDLKYICGEIPKAFDEPIGDPSIIPTLFLFREAVGSFKVIINGDASDELFSGYSKYRAFSIINAINKRIKIGTVLSLFLRLPRSLRSKIVKLILFRFSLRDSRVNDLVEQIGLLEDALNSGWIGEWLSRSNYKDVFDILGVDIKRPLCDVSHNDPRSFDFACYLPNNIFIKSDRASMHYSIESRSGFTNEFFRCLSHDYDLETLHKKHPEFVRKKPVSDLLNEVLGEDFLALKAKKMGFGFDENRFLVVNQSAIIAYANSCLESEFSACAKILIQWYSDTKMPTEIVFRCYCLVAWYATRKKTFTN